MHTESNFVEPCCRTRGSATNPLVRPGGPPASSPPLLGGSRPRGQFAAPIGATAPLRACNGGA